jgi:hypothetical protein
MAVLTPQPKMQFTTAAGVPLSGGKVYTYTAGTTTPQATYTDYTAATPNANPVILDSRGEANIWLGSALYKFKLTDANDVEIWTVDYISAPTSAISPVLSGNVVIDSDTPTPALKITQTGTGPVLRVQDSADPDATPFIIDTAGNVGIGTATPDAGLTVATVASFGNGTASAPSIAHLGDLDTGLWFPAVNTLAVSTGGAEQVRVTDQGKVGIGIGTPDAQLQVYGAGQASITTYSTSTNLGGTLYVRDSGSASNNGGAVVFGANQGAWAAIKGWLNDGSNNTNGGLSIYTRNATTDGTLTERVRVSQDGVFGFNSGYGSAGTAYGCRAWVNFNGTTNVAGFCTINGSGGITSVTDNGVGTYTLNFSNAMPDANYSLSACALAADNGNTVGTVACIERNSSTGLPQLKTTSAVQVSTFWVDRNNKNDVSDVSFQIFR